MQIWELFFLLYKLQVLQLRTRKTSQGPQMWVQVLSLPASWGALGELWILGCLHCGLVRMKKAGVGLVWPPVGARCPLTPICPHRQCWYFVPVSISTGGGYEHRLWAASLFHRRGMWLCPVDWFSHGNERKGAFNDRTLLRGLLMIPC